MSNEHPLLGKTITAITLSPDRESLTFTLSDGVIRADTNGDCCSQTWIENIEGEDALIGHTVASVEEIEMPNLGDVPTPHMPSVDSVAYYGTKIMTDAGICVIDYRNDSNGYYGGSLNWRTEETTVA